MITPTSINMPLLAVLLTIMLHTCPILEVMAQFDQQTEPAPTLRYVPIADIPSNKVSRTTADDNIFWCDPTKEFFDNQTTPKAPSADDCQQLMLNIAGPGQWLFTGAIWHQLLEYGTCAFGVFQPDMWSTTRIGNGDIISIISTAMHLWQKDGHLGGGGLAICEIYYPEMEGPYVPRLVYFDLFRNGGHPSIDVQNGDGDNGRDSGNKANPQFDHNSTFVDSQNSTLINKGNSTFVSNFNSTSLNITLGN